jgi:UDP-N-acetylglucosamine 4,6-dehydratase
MRRIGITGLSGSLGTALAEYFAPRQHTIVGITRDELKAEKLHARFAETGNVRCMVVASGLEDREGLARAFDGCDVLIHAAALKRISESVYATQELLKTNIDGTLNVLRVARELRIEKVIVVSSDKAVQATNLYGASKFCAECAAVQENAWSYPKGTSVVVVRYGNVLGSRGSVVHLWRQQIMSGSLTVTDPKMTRFLMTLSMAVRVVRDAIDLGEAGEILVPDLPAVELLTLAEAVACEADRPLRYTLVGLRPGGEKHDEELLSCEEVSRTRQHTSGMWAVAPAHRSWTVAPYASQGPAYPHPRYSSADARKLPVEHVIDLLRTVPFRPPND